MPMNVDKVLEEGADEYAGFGGEGGSTSPAIFAAMSKKKAYTADELAERTGLDVKQVKNCVGRNARLEKIGRKYVENVAYYFLLDDADEGA